MSEDRAPVETPGLRPGDADVPAAGRNLLQAFYASSRLGALWGFESKLTDEALGNLEAAVRTSAAAHGEVVLRFADDLVFLNDTRLRVDFSGYIAFRHVADRVTRRGIGEITISAAAPRTDLVRLLELLEARTDGTPAADEAFDASRETLRAAGVTGVTIGPRLHVAATRGQLGPTDVRQAAIQTYFRLLFVAQRAQAAAKEGQRIQARRCKRAVHEVIDVLERGEHFILAMTQVKNYHGFAACHAANVCVSACAAAMRAGLHKLDVADLGVAALLHELLPLDGTRTHAAGVVERDRRTARTLLSELGFGDGALRAVLCARDLHAPLDAKPGTEAALYRRIVRAACFLDVQTTPSGPDRPARPVRTVISAMSRAGAPFDPVVMRLLRAVYGVHPFGTVVRLDDGVQAVVHGRNPHFDQPARPVVRVVVDADGNPVEDGALIDLSRFDREKKRFCRSIVESRPACEAFARPADLVRVL